MSAIISPCGLYRYRLERTVAMEGPVYAFFGINPSTADASVDDATVRNRAGVNGFAVSNHDANSADPFADVTLGASVVDSLNQGYEVDTAENAELALERIDKQAPDFVLADADLAALEKMLADAGVPEGEARARWLDRLALRHVAVDGEPNVVASISPTEPNALDPNT